MPATARKPKRPPSYRRAVTARPTARQADVSIQGHGSVAIIVPETAAGREWCDENLGGDLIRWGDGIACEPRYVGDVAEGLRDAGLHVEGA